MSDRPAVGDAIPLTSGSWRCHHRSPASRAGIVSGAGETVTVPNFPTESAIALYRQQRETHP
ncbi:hypothetical protein ACIQNI_20035 [Streptomyces sp. NPDC091266]|uniref:hypothetical protein n=1 Tax=Streptomyces sp. NPDC091266 TaxID=3365978 RepID=UPI003825C9C5